MGLPYLSLIRRSNSIVTTLKLFHHQITNATSKFYSSPLFSHLKHFLTLINFFNNTINHDYDHDDQNDDHRPPPSLVAVPAVFFITAGESIKKRIPMMPYNTLLEKSNIGSSPPSPSSSCNYCIVCMNEIEGKEEVRVPINCCHVFHKECLDAWVDQGQPSCPLCRSKLLAQNQDDDDDDPWRKERMMYLFGDDYLFGHHN
ncbi:RING-H2 finger protein ATL54-like [Cannabis sativa]|uniref:RING-type domain-containing protein n=1 Tax=Cannabis sativa TaxID=3483 RepID=A0A803R1I4_CANSA|nr:RING-H2 finger protein ATL54-like [Cannabis sativa]